MEEPLAVMEEEEEEEEEPGRLSMTDVPAPHSTFTNSSLKPLEGTSSTWLAPWEAGGGGQVWGCERGSRATVRGQARMVGCCLGLSCGADAACCPCCPCQRPGHFPFPHATMPPCN